MTNEPQTYLLLVTLPNTTGEEADERAQDLEECITGAPVGEVLGFNREATVTHAPQLWTVMLDGPEFDTVRLFATERQCWEHLVNYASDELDHRLPLSHAALHPDLIEQWYSGAGYLVLVQQHDYPVHPASVVPE